MYQIVWTPEIKKNKNVLGYHHFPLELVHAQFCYKVLNTVLDI